jgi:hypothetical protein
MKNPPQSAVTEALRGLFYSLLFHRIIGLMLSHERF